jgi:PhzF family phenazine biosynthesis protein
MIEEGSMNHEVQRIAAFCAGAEGGNPAGVVIAAAMPPEADMRRIAADVGFSETVFAAPQGEGWRVRYFSPESEVPFCGHATIALGAVLALRHGAGIFPLTTNHASITVEGMQQGGMIAAALQSPATFSKAAPAGLTAEALALFGYGESDLDARIPPAVANGGASHLVLALTNREALARMNYELDAGRQLMKRWELTTIALVHAQDQQRFHARNPFASGGVYEDPATGAAAAAFAGYLRDIGWPHGGAIDILQGDDMGIPSRLHAEIPAEKGSSIRISGTARLT